MFLVFSTLKRQMRQIQMFQGQITTNDYSNSKGSTQERTETYPLE